MKDMATFYVQDWYYFVYAENNISSYTALPSFLDYACFYILKTFKKILKLFFLL